MRARQRGIAGGGAFEQLERAPRLARAQHAPSRLDEQIGDATAAHRSQPGRHDGNRIDPGGAAAREKLTDIRPLIGSDVYQEGARTVTGKILDKLIKLAEEQEKSGT